jgi:serine/threonine protein kinase
MLSQAVASVTEEPLCRGSRVGRYVIRGLVGRGAMGDVYRAHDPELGRTVAIKLIRAQACRAPGGDAAARARLLREARSLARICHPHVIAVHDAGAYDDGVFIAMDFVEGITLSCWLLSGIRPWQQVLQVFVDAGRGLAAAHDQGLVHHDFKPDNVMIAHDGHVRVMDFGLARELRVPERTGTETGDVRPPSLSTTVPTPDRRGAAPPATVGGPARGETARKLATITPLPVRPAGSLAGVAGTPAYMAPEQFLGSRTDARTDQFSFCVALYEALYGHRPFAGKNLVELRLNVFAGNVASAPRRCPVPRAVRRVLLRGMNPHPERRFAGMRDLLQALEGATLRPRPWKFWFVFTCAASLLAAASMFEVTGRARAPERTTGGAAGTTAYVAGRPG